MELRVKVDQPERRFDGRAWRRWIAALVIAILVPMAASNVFAQSLNEPLKVNETFALAAGHFDRQEYADAARLFGELARDYERYEQGKLAWFWLGESQISLNDHVAASQSFQRFLRVLPHHQLVSRARFRMAECAVREGKQEVAATLLETFLRDFPNDPLNEYALPWLGSIRLARGEPQLAQAAFERALKLFPRSPQSSASRIGLAKALLIQGQTHDAQRFLGFVAEHGDPALAAEAAFLIGKIEFQQGDLESAERHFRSARGGDAAPTLIDEVDYWIARCEIETGRLDEALESLQRLAERELSPGLNAAVFMDGAAVAGKLGRDDVADRLLAKFLNREPEPKWAVAALQLRMELAVQRSDYQLAAELAKRLLDRYPEQIDQTAVQETEVAALYRLQQFDLVVARTNGEPDGVTSDDGELHEGESALSSKLQYYRALSLLHLNRPDEAITCLKELQSKVSQDLNSGSLRSAVQRTLASCQLKQGEHGRAAELLADWLSKHPDDPDRHDAHMDLCRALALQSDWEAVRQWLGRITIPESRRDDHAGLLVDLADIALASWDAAQPAQPAQPIQSTPADDGDQLPTSLADAEAWYGRAVELLQQQDANQKVGNQSATDQETTNLAKTDQARAEELLRKALSGRAVCLVRLGKVQQGLELWSRLAEDPNNRELVRDRARGLAREVEQSSDYGTAASLYEIVVSLEADPAVKLRTELRQAWCLLQTASAVDAEKANLILDRIVDAGDPNGERIDAEAMFLRYWSAVNQNEDTVANDLRRRILRQFPEHPRWMDLAIVELEEAFAAGRLDDAARLADEIVARDGSEQHRARASYLLGRIAVSRRQWDAAVVTLQRARELNPDGTDAVRAAYWIAESLYQIGEYAEAAPQFQQLAESPHVDASLQPWVLLRWAQCGLKVGDWQAVESGSETGLQRFPEFARSYEWHYLLGRSAARIGMFDTAREHFNEVVRSSAGRTTELAAEAEWWIGETWFHQQQFKKAIEAYYRVDSLYSFDHWRAAALLQAAKCQERLGNWAHAAALYRQLVSRHPTSEFRDEAERRLNVALQQASRSGVDKPTRK